jgi:hypothetical protein
MIKIFDRTPAFPDKVNFIDERNNLIGFDMSSCCCEDFGWFITDTELNNKKGGGEFTLEDYNFNANSLKINRYSDDEGGEIIIELKGKHLKDSSTIAAEQEMYVGASGYINKYLPAPDLYLHIFNKHNGWYSHGFNLKIDDERVECSI